MIWNKTYEIGIDEIDAQHKHLFELAERMHTALKVDHQNKVIMKILTELVEYTKEHFSAEEALMKEIDFPDIETHKAEHIELSKKVKQVLIDLKSDKALVSLELYHTLKHWVSDHIIQEDMKIRTFYKAQNTTNKPVKYQK